MRRVQTLTVVLGVVAWMPIAPSVQADPLMERVTGQGEITVPADPGSRGGDYTVSAAVAAFEDADSRVWGTITGFTNGVCFMGGGGWLAPFMADVHCVDIAQNGDFNEAWVYAVVTDTSEGWGSFLPMGWPFVLYIRDHGNQEVDQMYMAHPLLVGHEDCVQGCGSQPNVMCCQGGGNDSAPLLVNGNFTVHSRSTKPTPTAGDTWSLVKRLYR